MADNHSADLFTIPDFWKRSTWQQQAPPLTAEERRDGFFSLEINGNTDSLLYIEETQCALGPNALLGNENFTFFLGNGEPEAISKSDNGGDLFKIPDFLSEALPDDPQTCGIQEATSEKGPEPVAEPCTRITSDTEDIWLSWDYDTVPPPKPDFKTWTSFENVDITDATCILGTEQGPEFVDALVAEDNILVRSSNTKTSSVTIDTRKYCACLLALALGRSSALFLWNDSKKSFASVLESARISGFTLQVLRSAEETFLECGNHSRYLRAFVDHTYTAAAPISTPSRVALARGVDSLLLTIQGELGTRGQRADSLLQLQALLRPVASLFKFISGLVNKLTRSVTSTGAKDEQFLSMLYQEAQSMEYSVVFMRDVIKQLLQLVSEPWLSFVGEWIGLGPNSKATLWTGEFKGKGFVRPCERIWVDDMGTELAEPDYFYDEDRMPAFIPKEMAKDLFGAGRNLRFLWTNHPEHPLCEHSTILIAGTPPLAWQFDWESIRALDQKAFVYEKALVRSIATQKGKPLPKRTQSVSFLKEETASSRQLPVLDFNFFGKTEDEIELSMQTSIAKLNGPLPQSAEEGLALILRRQLFNDGRSKRSDSAALDDFAPHWSLLPLLSFGPVIAAQSRIINRECMRLLFVADGIREHLELQRAFQLLGNGMFCSRLSHALFDTELAGAEQGTGVQLSSVGIGLRLSRRNNENWPPASSELRLALMGVLAESYYQGKEGTNKKPGAVGKQELPGGMSFAIRDLSIEEMDKCMNPDSLEAMDFLRLSYKPPLALMSIITPGILSKYDRVFMLLLRVLRMYHLVNQLFDMDMHSQSRRTATPSYNYLGKHRCAHADNVTTRFLIESRHFVANIMSYFMDVGLGVPWRRFEMWLDAVQQNLDEEDVSVKNTKGRTMGVRGGVDQIGPDQMCERHDQALDEIMLALLLRKRQQPLLLLLQGIFELIIEFAKSARGLARDSSTAGDSEERQEVRRAHRETTKRLYASFRKKVAAFIAVCRGLSEKEADSVARKDYQQQQQYQDGSRAGEGNSLSRLLLMLDFNGSYTSPSASRG
ncbi:hypothetical protein SEPCBS57363_000248 [Sporothrix epigloea]|uniref:Spindle pole body component n=1 Tax=Sporothrix epigloea TaxID=1892477 RepID=A0ABP0D3N4_9PEZI